MGLKKLSRRASSVVLHLHQPVLMAVVVASNLKMVQSGKPAFNNSWREKPCSGDGKGKDVLRLEEEVEEEEIDSWVSCSARKIPYDGEDMEEENKVDYVARLVENFTDVIEHLN